MRDKNKNYPLYIIMSAMVYIHDTYEYARNLWFEAVRHIKKTPTGKQQLKEYQAYGTIPEEFLYTVRIHMVATRKDYLNAPLPDYLL